MNLEEIKAREQAATPGPWESIDKKVAGWDGKHGVKSKNGWDIVPCACDWEGFGYGTSSQDSNFIAHARTDIPELISEVERLTAENSELKFERDDYIKIGEDYRNKLLEAESDRDTLKKALEVASKEVNTAFETLESHHVITMTHKASSTQENVDTWIQQAQKQEEKE